MEFPRLPHAHHRSVRGPLALRPSGWHRSPKLPCSWETAITACTARNAIDWRLDSIRQVSREIDRHTAPGETVLHLAWVPGGIARGVRTGSGDSRGPHHCAASSADELRRCGLPGPEFTPRSNTWQPCRVVLGNQNAMGTDSRPFEKMLKAQDYRVFRLGHARALRLRAVRLSCSRSKYFLVISSTVVETIQCRQSWRKVG